MLKVNLQKVSKLLLTLFGKEGYTFILPYFTLLW
jgi:hypothetical protein